MTDKELLEMAAKAAGYNAKQAISALYPYPNVFYVEGRRWNPLTDDGDALRLAVKLTINLEFMETLSRKPFGINVWPVGRGDFGASEDEAYVKDPHAATRRAIVRAAAEIGKAML